MPDDRTRYLMWQAWHELNAIRARDGVPFDHMGYPSDVDEAYFSQLVDDLAEWLGEEAKPWPPQLLKERR